MQKFKKYKKNDKHSYTFGAFPTLELIRSNNYNIIAIFIDDKYNDKENLIKELEDKNIYYEIAPNVIKRISNKENTYLAGVFEKKNYKLERNNHIILHDISDMGNLGTIIRSMLAFGCKDLVLIGNVADIYNPKVIRSSMGAFFKIRFTHYDTIEKYMEEFDNKLYMFMLSNDMKDSIFNKKLASPYSLVFGNEGAGLPNEFEKFGEKIFIPQSDEVDSLNLPIAVSIGLYEFGGKR